MEKIFIQLGLSEVEAKTLITLMELGASGVTALARAAGQNRTSCYHILDRLLDEGLVNQVGEKKNMTYVAQTPEAILNLLEKRAAEHNDRLQQMKAAMPQLKALYSEKGSKPRVRFFEGKEGIETAYEDTLSSHEGLRAYASVNDIEGLMPHYFPKYYQRRKDKGIHMRAIFPDTPEARILCKRNKVDDREVVLVPVEQFNFSPEINIYDNKVIIISPPEQFAVIIESKEIAEAQKRIFELAWEGAKVLGEVAE